MQSASVRLFLLVRYATKYMKFILLVGWTPAILGHLQKSEEEKRMPATKPLNLALIAAVAISVPAFADHITYKITLGSDGRAVTAPTISKRSFSLGHSVSFEFIGLPENSELRCKVGPVDSDPSQIDRWPVGDPKDCGLKHTPRPNDALFYYVVPDKAKPKTVTEFCADQLEGSCGQLKQIDAGIAKLAVALKESQQDAAKTEQQIQDTSEAIKAYANMSSDEAAKSVTTLLAALKRLQGKLADNMSEILGTQTKFDKKKVERDGLLKDIHPDPSNRMGILRAGVVPLAKDARTVYYRFVRGTNEESPYRLERMVDFPVLTVNNSLYLVILNNRENDKVKDFQLSYTSNKGQVIDVAPIRPTIDQSIIKSLSVSSVTEKKVPDFNEAYVDRVLMFATKFAGESALSVTVSSYGKVVTADKEEVISGVTKVTHTTETKTIKLLDNEKWPQVHSLFHYNLSTGIVASWLRDPAYSRVLASTAVPANGTTPAVPATYTTASDRGSVRAMPVLAFSAYLRPMDVQVPWRWADLLPAPTVAFSLTTPADDYFFGGSSEIRRNVQLLYGYHLGKVTRLAPRGIDDRGSSTAPATLKRFRGNAFVGLTFNVNFIKGLFK